MASQVAAAPNSVHGSESIVQRPSACKYQPTIWGDHFLTNASHSETANDLIQWDLFEELKREVKNILSEHFSKGESSKKLCLIDAVQHLGVAYHFKSEIEDAMKKIYHDYNNESDDDLYTVSLQFRLLRQYGFKVSCDIFQKFKDSDGNFKPSLIQDVRGMLSFYEAAHLGIRGENILDEAIDFTTQNLQSMMTKLSPHQAKEIARAVDRPIRKWLERVEARHFMDVYAKDESHNSILLKFAKLDFNILQGMHQRELSSITQWWKSLDVTTKLPYARDRIVELYFWIVGVYFEPQYSLARMILTKVIATASILDDTYDSYGTYEELKPLTEAIQRWDDGTDLNQLSETMRLVYRIVIDVYKEIEKDLAEEGRSHYVYYGKEAMKRLVQCYFIEAEWLDQGHIPTVEEYFPISIVSCGYMMLIANSFLGMGSIATTEVFEWASKDPKIIKAASVVCRFVDDIVSREFEQERSHVASGIEIYVKHHGLAEEEVVRMFRKKVANAWKDINEELLRPTVVPAPILERALNFARAIDVIYKDVDGYTNPHVIKDFVASVLKDPVI